jgi:hypothetical protein
VTTMKLILSSLPVVSILAVGISQAYGEIED